MSRRVWAAGDNEREPSGGHVVISPVVSSLRETAWGKAMEVRRDFVGDAEETRDALRGPVVTRTHHANPAARSTARCTASASSSVEPRCRQTCDHRPMGGKPISL